MKANVEKGKIDNVGEPIYLLPPGELGTFDSEGVMASCFLPAGDITYLYTIGWQSMREVLHCISVGRAIFNPDSVTLTREFIGPVLTRNRNNPFTVTSPYIIAEESAYIMWFTACTGWKKDGDVLTSYYSIKRATSPNGLDWTIDDKPSIEPEMPYETNLARPTVQIINGDYHMWFCKIDNRIAPTYRVGYAVSSNGIDWERRDKEIDIPVSETGWDSEMVAHPFVFRHKDWLYMLYCGNRFGRDGMGYAVSKVQDNY